jgi:uncharacterized protein (UPF0248 family)
MRSSAKRVTGSTTAIRLVSSRSKGDFATSHKDEIIHLARHQEEQEKAEHPLHRIMEIEERDGAIVVRTTDIHLPRRIGEALRHAYHGELEFHYAQEAYFIRVRWSRDG